MSQYWEAFLTKRVIILADDDETKEDIWDSLHFGDANIVDEEFDDANVIGKGEHIDD
jgi:hypothetical protein